jgi:hypothetical protein
MATLNWLRSTGRAQLATLNWARSTGYAQLGALNWLRSTGRAQRAPTAPEKIDCRGELRSPSLLELVYLLSEISVDKLLSL